MHSSKFDVACFVLSNLACKKRNNRFLHEDTIVEKKKRKKKKKKKKSTTPLAKEWRVGVIKGALGRLLVH